MKTDIIQNLGIKTLRFLCLKCGNFFPKELLCGSFLEYRAMIMREHISTFSLCDGISKFSGKKVSNLGAVSENLTK